MVKGLKGVIPYFPLLGEIRVLMHVDGKSILMKKKKLSISEDILGSRQMSSQHEKNKENLKLSSCKENNCACVCVCVCFSIHPNLRSEIYCQAVAEGGLKEWEFVWKKFRNCNDASEKERLRRALSCTRETWLLSR